MILFHDLGLHMSTFAAAAAAAAPFRYAAPVMRTSAGRIVAAFTGDLRAGFPAYEVGVDPAFAYALTRPQELNMPRPTITFKSRAPRPEETLYRQGDVLNVGVGYPPTFLIDVRPDKEVWLHTQPDFNETPHCFSKEGLRALGQALINVADNL